MKMLSRVMLGLSVAALFASGCAERPGQKKEDDKKAEGKDAKKPGNAAKKDEKKQ